MMNFCHQINHWCDLLSNFLSTNVSWSATCKCGNRSGLKGHSSTWGSKLQSLSLCGQTLVQEGTRW
jgi:hypothetical protein